MSSFQILNIEIIEWIASTFLAWNPSRDRFEVLLSLRSLTWMAGILRNTTISKKKTYYQGKDHMCERKFCKSFLGRTKVLNTGKIDSCMDFWRVNFYLSSFRILNIGIVEWIASTFQLGTRGETGLRSYHL